MKKIFLLFASFSVLNAQVSINQLFSSEELAGLADDLTIKTRVYLKYNALNENTHDNLIVPTTKFTGDEFLDYEMICDEKAFIPYDLEKESTQKVYEILTDPTLLKGSRYYSRRAREVKELIVDAFPIDEKGKKIVENAPKNLKPYTKGRFRQKDNKFGKLDFISELYNEESNFILVTTCDTAIPFIAKKGEYKIVSFFMYDELRKGFYYYAVYGMKINTDSLLKKGGLKTLAPTTFTNRLRAALVKISSLLGYSRENEYNPWENDPLGRDHY